MGAAAFFVAGLLLLLNSSDSAKSKSSYGCAWIGKGISECGQSVLRRRADSPSAMAALLRDPSSSFLAE
jgi:hypothetical protein